MKYFLENTFECKINNIVNLVENSNITYTDGTKIEKYQKYLSLIWRDLDTAKS